MRRKYLDDIGYVSITEVDDHKEFKKQREIYGFDARETWDMRTSFYEWLYERLMMFVEVGGEVVNLNFHKFEYNGATYTQIELINKILELIRFYFSDEYDDYDEEHILKTSEICNMWSIIIPAMWW